MGQENHIYPAICKRCATRALIELFSNGDYKIHEQSINCYWLGHDPDDFEWDSAAGQEMGE